MSMAIGKIADIFIDAEIQKSRSKLVSREMSPGDLAMMDQDGDNNISLLEFVEHFLLRMQKVDPELLRQIHNQFSCLDSKSTLFVYL